MSLEEKLTLVQNETKIILHHDTVEKNL
jgi:hypothetical protein